MKLHLRGFLTPAFLGVPLEALLGRTDCGVARDSLDSALNSSSELSEKESSE